MTAITWFVSREEGDKNELWFLYSMLRSFQFQSDVKPVLGPQFPLSRTLYQLPRQMW